MINSRKFVRELQAAGLVGLQFGWNPETGVLRFGAVSAEQRAAVEALAAAHDPSPEPAEERREDRATALMALVGTEAAEAALDGFLRSIKARQDLPPAVVAYIQKHRL